MIHPMLDKRRGRGGKDREASKRPMWVRTRPPEDGLVSLWDIMPEKDQVPGEAVGTQQAMGYPKALPRVHCYFHFVCLFV